MADKIGTDEYGEILIYQTDDGQTNIEVKIEDDTVWLTQQQMSELFQTSRTNVVEHIKHIYEEGELDEISTCRNFRQVRTVIAFHRVKEANKNSIFNLKRPLAMNQILFDVLHSESKNIHSEYMTKCYFFELSVICSNIPILSIKSFSTGESVSSSRFLYLSYSA